MKTENKKIKELEQKAGGLVVSGVSKKKKTEGLQRDTTNTQEEITTNTVAVHELILRYNNEIEKAKKQKMKCLEVLLKFGEISKTEKEQSEQETRNIADIIIEAYKQRVGE